MSGSQINLLPPEYKPVVRHRTLQDRQAALCRELEYLRSEIKRLKEVIAFKDGVLLYTARFFEDLLRNPKPQTIESLKRRISQLKGAADRERGGLPE